MLFIEERGKPEFSERKMSFAAEKRTRANWVKAWHLLHPGGEKWVPVTCPHYPLLLLDLDHLLSDSGLHINREKRLSPKKFEPVVVALLEWVIYWPEFPSSPQVAVSGLCHLRGGLKFRLIIHFINKFLLFVCFVWFSPTWLYIFLWNFKYCMWNNNHCILI